MADEPDEDLEELARMEAALKGQPVPEPHLLYRHGEDRGALRDDPAQKWAENPGDAPFADEPGSAQWVADQRIDLVRTRPTFVPPLLAFGAGSFIAGQLYGAFVPQRALGPDRLIEGTLLAVLEIGLCVLALLSMRKRLRVAVQYYAAAAILLAVDWFWIGLNPLAEGLLKFASHAGLAFVLAHLLLAVGLC